MKTLALSLVFAVSISAAAIAQPAPAPAAPPVDLSGAIAMVKLYGPTVTPLTTASTAYLTIATTTGRSQNVFVTAGLGGPKGAKTRTVYAIAAKLSGPIDAALGARLLLANNSGLPYGYWATDTDSDNSPRILYEVELNADASAEAVQSVMSTVAAKADALEAELNGKDVY
jgi:hypothetical protein